MADKMAFDYYGDESNQFSFYRIPRQLVTGERFRKLSSNAKLKAVFWDMTAITTYVEKIYHPGDGEEDTGWTEYILHITITPKTADDMRAAYSFNI